MRYLAFLICLFFISGCCTLPETHPSRYQCRTDPEDPLAWACTKDDTRFACRKTTCKPTWCDLPLQYCNLPPLTDGTDECGFPCSKPSTQWPNCITGGRSDGSNDGTEN